MSTGAQFLRVAASQALTSIWSKVAATLVVGFVLAGLAWVVLRGAAVARRRIPLALDQPLHALWQTIGWCGNPPRDPSRSLALIALILALLPWVIVPIGLLVGWFTS